MGFRMIEPWKHPRSDVLWFRKRVPEKFVALMGRREIKFSLGTKDMDEARLRSVEQNLKLERTWQDYAEGRPRGHNLAAHSVCSLGSSPAAALSSRAAPTPRRAHSSTSHRVAVRVSATADRHRRSARSYAKGPGFAAGAWV
jgi:hypothetical protein